MRPDRLIADQGAQRLARPRRVLAAEARRLAHQERAHDRRAPFLRRRMGEPVGMRALLSQITAFTVAHSISLALTMYGVVSLPSRADQKSCLARQKSCLARQLWSLNRQLSSSRGNFRGSRGNFSTSRGSISA
ncbi:MAG TPA: HupE/UreJ family protein [Thermoanaerobaculia bacterium]|nr:HupE/UreJ family protein [Thermoanaerobaculia bacterium]